MPLLFLNKFCNRDHFVQFRGTDKVAIIPQCRTENTADRFMVTDLISICREDLLLAMSVRTIGLAPDITAIILVSIIRIWEAFPQNNACPGIINIDVAGIVEHVGGETSWRTHIHF